MRGYGVSLDNDVYGRRFLPGGVLFVPLLPRHCGFACENLPVRACDDGAFGVVTFVKASRGFPVCSSCLVVVVLQVVALVVFGLTLFFVCLS
jgi:hypothetical protein